MAVDIALIKDSEGIYDIAIGSDGQLVTTDGFDSSLTLSLFTDKRATASQVPQAERRRGFWGNVFEFLDGFERGSWLWLLDQERTTRDTLNAAIDYVKNGLQWLIDDGHALKVNVTAAYTDIRNGVMAITIVIVRDQSVTETVSYEIWLNTGV